LASDRKPSWAQGVGRSNRPAPTNDFNEMQARFRGDAKSPVVHFLPYRCNRIAAEVQTQADNPTATDHYEIFRLDPAILQCVGVERVLTFLTRLQKYLCLDGGRWFRAADRRRFPRTSSEDIHLGPHRRTESHRLSFLPRRSKAFRTISDCEPE
jgi:hypothetical protein